MNKTYRIIWNKAKGIYQVVSENAKTAGKSKNSMLAAATIGLALSALSTSAMATAVPAGWDKISDTRTLPGGDYTGTSIGGQIIGVANGAVVDTNTTPMNITYDVGLYGGKYPVTWNVFAIGSLNPNRANQKAGNFTANSDVNIVYNSIADKDSSGGGRHGIGSTGGSTFVFNENVSVTEKNLTQADITNTQHYGVFAGSSPEFLDQLGSATTSSSDFKKNLKIDMSMPLSGGVDNTIVGIRSAQNYIFKVVEENGSWIRKKTGVEHSSGLVKVEGLADITMDGYGAQGVYASGGDSSIELNDANITMNNGALGSAAIKIGKDRSTILGKRVNQDRPSSAEGKGKVVITGHANINTENSNGAAIQMYNSGSRYIQDSATSSSKIRSKVAALEVGGLDWTGSSAGTNNTVSARDADWSNKKGSLILVGKSSDGTVTHGQEASLTFQGKSTNLNVANDGYLLDVNGLANEKADISTLFGRAISEGAEAGKQSDVKFSLSEGYMQGLIHTNNAVSNDDGDESDSAKTTVSLDKGATWRLKKNTSATEQVANMNALSVNNSTLDAAFYGSDGSYTVKVHDVLAKGSAAGTTPTMGTANFANNSIINLAQAKSTLIDGASETQPAQSLTDTLTIDANYVSDDSTKLYMDTKWDGVGDYNGANSTSDKLVIKGTATGKTTVIPIGADGKEGFIDGTVTQLTKVINTIPVIEVQGGSKADTFVGTAKAAGRAVEVQLTSSSRVSPYPAEGDLAADKANDQKYYYWTMNAKTPDIPAVPGTPIYDKRVPGYVVAPKVISELGFTSLGTLHQRIGENQTIAWDNCGQCSLKPDDQTWARVFGKHLDDQGKERFGYKSDLYGVQLGHNFLFENNAKTKGWYVTGAYLTLGHSNNKFYDKYKAVNGMVVNDKLTGKGKTNLVNLGLTHTRYSENGNYLDLVGQLSYVKNTARSTEAESSSQSGYGVALSAEVGRPYALNKHDIHEGGWLVEPQAQLMYQFNHLGAGSDEARTVKALNYHQLRGRIGARLAYNAQAGKENYRTNTLYLTANILHDFIKSPTVSVGVDKLSEKYTSTWGDVGVGIQLPVRKAGYIYADVHYERSFSEGLRSGYSGNIGYKYSW